MTKKEAEATDNAVASLAEEIGTAERALNELEAEKVSLPDRIQRAARDADAAEMVSLRRRFDEIDLHVGAARVRLGQLRLHADESRLVEAEAEAARLVAPMERAKGRLDEARAAFKKAEGEFAVAQSEVSALRMSIGDRRRRIDALMAEASTPLAPVVRSLPHAPKAA